MSGFSDPIVGGVGTLIRDYIQSANFVSGTSGWQIRKDGVAEFLDIIARGDLSGSTLTIPGLVGQQRIVIDDQGITSYDSAGTVVLKIQPAAPTLLTTNLYSLPNAESVIGVSDGIVSLNPDSSGVEAVNWIFGNFILGQPNGSPFSSANPFTLQFGGGDAGAYYHEEWFLDNQSIPNNTDTILTGQSNYLSKSDYASGWLNTSTGLWHPPVTGMYTINIMAATGAVVGTRWYLRVVEVNSGNVLGAFDVLATSTTGYANVNVIQEFVTTQRIAFHLYQNSGGAQTVKTTSPFTGYITIHRHL